MDPARADMTRLPFAPGSFDLVWSEGAIYIAGFEAGLRAWRELLRPGGGIAVTECTWLRPEPPAPLRRFFGDVYPAMTDVAGNVELVRRAGLALVDHFTLPAACWWAYYAPIEARLDAWLAARPGDSTARAVVEAERAELDLYRRYSDWYGYEFFVMRAG